MMFMSIWLIMPTLCGMPLIQSYKRNTHKKQKKTRKILKPKMKKVKQFTGSSMVMIKNTPYEMESKKWPC